MRSGVRCLYYAFGSGLGHAMRTLALARQMIRRIPGQHVVLVNTPFSQTVAAIYSQEPGLQLLPFPSSTTPAEAQRFVAEQLQIHHPDLLIVDTFPRGIVGEFVAPFVHWAGGLRVLISRTLPEEYVSQYDLKDFVTKHYDGIIVPGEISPFQDFPRAMIAPPFFVRSDDELLSPDAAAASLKLDHHQACVLLVGSGTLDECRQTIRLGKYLAQDWPASWPPLRISMPAEIDVSTLTIADKMVNHLPLIDCLQAARIVIGSGGYNLFHETRVQNIPAIFFAKARKYDDQSTRVWGRQAAVDLGELKQQIQRELNSPFLPSRHYENGAEVAADNLSKLLSGITN